MRACVQGELEEAKGRVSELETEVAALRNRIASALPPATPTGAGSAAAAGAAGTSGAGAGGSEEQIVALQRQNGELLATLRKLRDLALAEKSALETKLAAADAALKVLDACGCDCARACVCVDVC